MNFFLNNDIGDFYFYKTKDFLFKIKCRFILIDVKYDQKIGCLSLVFIYSQEIEIYKTIPSVDLVIYLID